MLSARALDPLLPLANALDPWLDPLAVRLGRALFSRLQEPPLRAASTPARNRALEEVSATYVPRIASLLPGLRARDVATMAHYDAMVAEAIVELRGVAGARAAKRRVERVAHALDRVLQRDRPEWLDDPSFDMALRVRTLDRLDLLNTVIGSYDSFATVLEPAVERARAAGVKRPVVVDLASGHAGFALLMAERLGAREGRVRVVATDLVTEYLDLGREKARALGLGEDAVSFVAQDALDLDDLPEKIGAPVDVICCTQSVHHFSPGMVARLLGEASAHARHGVVFVDGERDPLAFAMVVLFGAALSRFGAPFVHDSLVSIRRMFTEQELHLIARLAPSRDSRDGAGVPVRAGWLRPGHVFVAT